MVRATIAAGRAGGSSASVLGGDKANVGSESRVDVVGVDSGLATRRVAGHVLVQHTEDTLARRFVVGKDSLGAKETTLLTSIEVELDGVLGAETSGDKNAQGLKQVDSTGAIVIGTRSAGSGGTSGGIVVGTNNDWNKLLVKIH